MRTTRRGYYTCTTNGHNKFWEYAWVEETGDLVTRFGRIGSGGQMSTRKTSYNNLMVLINSKLAKGYIKIHSSVTGETKPDVFDEDDPYDFEAESAPDPPKPPAEINLKGKALLRRKVSHG